MNNLPDDAVSYIISLLATSDKRTCSFVCKRFRQIAGDMMSFTWLSGALHNLVDQYFYNNYKNTTSLLRLAGIYTDYFGRTQTFDEKTTVLDDFYFNDKLSFKERINNCCITLECQNSKMLDIDTDEEVGIQPLFTLKFWEIEEQDSGFHVVLMMQIIWTEYLLFPFYFHFMDSNHLTGELFGVSKLEKKKNGIVELQLSPYVMNEDRIVNFLNLIKYKQLNS